jgi:hypothetical protein
MVLRPVVTQVVLIPVELMQTSMSFAPMSE